MARRSAARNLSDRLFAIHLINQTTIRNVILVQSSINWNERITFIYSWTVFMPSILCPTCDNILLADTTRAKAGNFINSCSCNRHFFSSDKSTLVPNRNIFEPWGGFIPGTFYNEKYTAYKFGASTYRLFICKILKLYWTDQTSHYTMVRRNEWERKNKQKTPIWIIIAFFTAQFQKVMVLIQYKRADLEKI